VTRILTTDLSKDLARLAHPASPRPLAQTGKNDLGSPWKAFDSFLYTDFIFSPRYRVWRHLTYWSFHITIWTVFWIVMWGYFTFGRMWFNMAMWIPAFIAFGYPLAYWAVPGLLLKGKVVEFCLLVLAWAVAGTYLSTGYRLYVYAPAQIALGLDFVAGEGFSANIYLCMTTSAASPMIIKFFKLWTFKQREWLRAQQEKTTAELQLLKSQVHPHFLFNTLNNIYSFSLEASPKTPEMILKLSSLLRYMLNDCRAEQVRLEKELEIMKNYIDLEKERYAHTMKITWHVEGDLEDKYIAPLLMLPFLENAFKHGASEQLETSWLSVDVSARSHTLQCKIANRTDERVAHRPRGQGIGIENVKKRLELIYPGHYQLQIHEGNPFVVSLRVELTGFIPIPLASVATQTIPA
jgi:two-component system sensor histidine kinase AlgZ